MSKERHPWIRDHKVCFESTPFYCLRNPAKHQIGYELRLFAQSNGSGRVDPGSPKSYQLYMQLREIAGAVLPQESNGCRFQIESFDFSVRLRPETGLKDEVQLVIAVVHREDYFAPANQSQADCLAEIQRRLTEMGACQRAWR